MSDDARYPLGRFSPPETIDATVRGTWLAALAQAPARAREAMADLSDGQLDTPYRDGGWTVRQVAHHLPDSHMHAYLRFKWALTEDTPIVPAYDQALWAGLPDSRSAPVGPALDLLSALHVRWLALLQVMSDEDFERRFVNARTGAESTLGWLLGLYAWHGAHHTAQVLALRGRKGW